MRELRTLLLPLLLLGCDKRPAQWDAFISFDENEARTEIIKGFKTYELCRAASLQRLEAEHALETGYFECGYKCEFKPAYGLNICKETRD